MFLLNLPLAWPFLCLALVGIGAAVRRGLGGGGLSLGHVARDGWLGWGIVLGCLQLIHLLVPVGVATLVVVIVAGLGLLLYQLRRSGPCRCRLPAILLLVVPAIWLASDWTFRSLAIDTGLYHLGAIRWAREYPIVPGLGLLHDRFAFNNGSFLWAALCEHWPWGVGRAAAGVEILFYFSLVNALLGCGRMVRAATRRPRDIFDALSLIPLLVVIMEDFRYDGPLSPDMLVFPLGLLVVSELLGYLEHPTRDRAVALLMLSACGVAVKLSFAGAAFGVWVVVLWVGRARRSTWVAAAAVAILIGGGWCLRSVVLSGWPVYPLGIGGVPVEWQIPAVEVSATHEVIRSWARAPGGDAIGLGAWIALMSVQRFALLAPLLLLVAALGIAVYRQPRGGGWPALVPGTVGVMFWLVTAPLPRFAGSLPWTLGLAAVACSLNGLTAARLRLVTLALLGLLAVRVVDPWAYVTSVRNGPPALPFVELDIRFTDAGLAILIPVEGNQCWAAPLPHAPRLDPRLALRQPDDPASGFRRTRP